MYTLKKHFLKIGLLLSIVYVKLFAVGIDTISIPSSCMHKSFPALLVLPDSYYVSTRRYPVLYLLHGHSSGPSSWYLVIPNLKKWADSLQMILLCPDGDYDSWYLDSPVLKTRKFETYFTKEIVAFMDTRYRTIANRKSRGISGISMGGHGAFYLGLKHPDIYGVIGSSSGGLDLLPFDKEWNLQSLLGDIKRNKEQWKKFSCLYLLDSIKKTDQNLWIDCGYSDFFLEVNRAFHKKLLEKNIEHAYLESPGGHELAYWKKSYINQFHFFRQHLSVSRLNSH